MIGVLSSKVNRATTIGRVIGHGAGTGSRLGLLSAYLSTLRSTTSQRELSLRLRIDSTVFPFRMRQSDVFVLEEILLQRQYDLRTPPGPAPTIIDAGANIGLTVLWFLAQYPDAVIHAFEPAPDNYRLLRANVAPFERVSTAPVAVGAAASDVVLHLASHGAMHSLKDQADEGQGAITVGCIALGSYLAAQGIERVDLLKMDVEGSELDLLVGLGDRLDSVRTLVGEMHETLVDESAFYGLLKQRGFRQVRREYYGTGKAEGVHVFEMTR
jgi:FkbM family methyltransferase